MNFVYLLLPSVFLRMNFIDGMVYWTFMDSKGFFFRSFTNHISYVCKIKFQLKGKKPSWWRSNDAKDVNDWLTHILCAQTYGQSIGKVSLIKPEIDPWTISKLLFTIYMNGSKTHMQNHQWKLQNTVRALVVYVASCRRRHTSIYMNAKQKTKYK